MIIAESLCKTFLKPDGGEIHAVRDLSFRVSPGEIYGLLGPNGAGKTTTLRLLTGMMRADRGRVVIAGHEVGEDRAVVGRAIGFLTAHTGLYGRLTAGEMLVYFGRLQGMSEARIRWRLAELCQLLAMDGFLKQRCDTLSSGQKQRVSLARTLIQDPPVLILDEPTLGLDVITNRIVLAFIRQAADRGKAVVMSTHYLDEAEALCDRFGLIHQGRLIAEGTLEELRRESERERLSAIFLQKTGLEENRLDPD